MDTFGELRGVLADEAARDVAQAMLSEALAPAQEGVTVLPSAKLREIAASEA